MNLYFIEIYSEGLRVMLFIIVFQCSKLSSISKSNFNRDWIEGAVCDIVLQQKI